MAKSTISYPKIAITAKSLESKNEPITIAAIKQFLNIEQGNNDSDADIEAHLLHWQQTHDKATYSTHISSQDELVSSIAEGDTEEVLFQRTEALNESLALVRATLESTEDGNFDY